MPIIDKIKDKIKEILGIQSPSMFYIDQKTADEFARLARNIGKVPRQTQIKISNCNNCGAVLHGNKCEYCGTEYGGDIRC